jgi:hypothetical protein
MSLETYGSCSKSINEECRLHPVECGSCQNELSCGLKETVKAHPDQIKRCRWFRSKKKDLTSY